MSASNKDNHGLFGLTQRQIEIALLAWQCCGEASVDYDKLKDLASLASVKSARDTWRPIKNKLMAATKTPDGGKKRKAEDNEEPGPTVKRGKKATSTSTTTKAEDEDIEQDQIEVEPDQHQGI